MITAPQLQAILMHYAAINPRFAPDFRQLPVLGFWHGEFGDVPAAQLRAALDHAMRTLDAFPSVKQLREAVGAGELTDADQARDVAERILTAIGRWGSQRHRRDNVAAYIGDLGEHVVAMQGGWLRVCESSTTENAPTQKAQWRELAAVVLRKARTPEGIAAAPRLPSCGETPSLGRSGIAALISGAAAKCTP